MKNHINIKYVKNLNNDALRGIVFYTQELGILQERLQEIAADNTAREVQEKVEHFQNQFSIHQDYLTKLRHDIQINDKAIEAQLLVTDAVISERTAAEHAGIHENYITEENIFNNLRHEFNRFAAQWM
ncbi:hypothetical protein SAMN05192574_101545 [Mucilaginibacter gossypiicola]|uniref:Uncharacterized protein n=1 Tax=Mucilaginibacter gossypiicola TaxID=551995 RepID=A0A1H8ALI9_9SPHI|nr:hypothetical protein [Mucilaginibacter gossypiicola]SEM70854.1 hypothetical protein SAMN05192574_101545 [Mucilaginibacter gossypiicola]